MHMPDLYCSECGAANPREAQTCFACNCVLTAPPENVLPGLQPSKTTTPETPRLLQFDLLSGTMTMIHAHTPPATQQLLHERYQVLEKVGTGGFGAVYKARDTRQKNRLVAVKAIELDTLSASQAIEATDTFNRELQLLSSLDHPLLPHIHEHFIDATHWYLVMDFIAGEPLDEYLQQIDEPSLPLKEVVDIGLQLCDVLRYLHTRKPAIIFRDVKPANIMRTPGGRLYLIDFGIARRFKPGQTRDTTPLGSPGFAAPEQYGKAQTTPRSDIYGLGATLYFLLTGYDPASTPFNLPPIASLCPELPTPLTELLTSMLALDPTQRPSSILPIQQALTTYQPVSLPRGLTSLPQPASQNIASASAHRWPWLSPFLTRIFLALIIVAILAACILSAHLAMP